MRYWKNKIISLSSWRTNLDLLDPGTIILTNGCFDLIHRGHINLLENAKVRHPQSHLVVAVNSDASVRQLKGESRPLVPQDQRLAVVAALEAVDCCFLFDGLRCDYVIRVVRPEIWIKGGDYTLETLDASERAAAEEVGAQIRIHPNEPGLSTTSIISRCQAPAPR